MTPHLLTLEGVVDSWGIADSEHDRDLCVRWLADQIRAKRITARKIRRRWYLNPADQAAALEAFANRRTVTASTDDTVAPRKSSLSVASQKLRSA